MNRPTKASSCEHSKKSPKSSPQSRRRLRWCPFDDMRSEEYGSQLELLKQLQAGAEVSLMVAAENIQSRRLKDMMPAVEAAMSYLNGSFIAAL